jgi:hypothetical protein
LHPSLKQHQRLRVFNPASRPVLDFSQADFDSAHERRWGWQSGNERPIFDFGKKFLLSLTLRPAAKGWAGTAYTEGSLLPLGLPDSFPIPSLAPSANFGHFQNRMRFTDLEHGGSQNRDGEGCFAKESLKWIRPLALCSAFNGGNQ